MKYNKLLKRTQSLLSEHYHVTFKDTNVLEICPTKKSLPFAFVIVESDLPDVLILSLAADLTNPILSAHLALLLSQIGHVELSEQFYISNHGAEMTWGEDAVFRCDLENNPDFLEIKPLTETRH